MKMLLMNWWMSRLNYLADVVRRVWVSVKVKMRFKMIQEGLSGRMQTICGQKRVRKAPIASKARLQSKREQKTRTTTKTNESLIDHNATK